MAHSSTGAHPSVERSALARPWPQALATGLAYALVGLSALLLAGPPGYAVQLYPPAGIGLAAALVWGRAGAFGAGLGAFVVNGTLGLLVGRGTDTAFILPLLIGLGAAAQAGLGAWLVRHRVGQPLWLSEPRDIALAGVLGGGVACVVSPTVATTALVSLGVVPPAGAAVNWLAWWTGDLFGVLIGAPVALAFIGQPAAVWRPRRRSLAAPLLAALALLAGGMWALGERERTMAAKVSERDADRLAAAVQQRLQLPVHVLQALVAAAEARGRADSVALGAVAAAWLTPGAPLQAVGYSQRVAAADLPGFEEEARAEGLAGFRVHHRDNGRALAADGDAVVVRRVEPMTGNAAALGVNALSIPAAREAILATLRSGSMSASAGFRLTQSASDETGLVLYQSARPKATAAVPPSGAASGAGPAGLAAGPVASREGVLFVALRLTPLLGRIDEAGVDGDLWCVVDPAPGVSRVLLVGATACAAASPGQFRVRRLQLADRALELRLLPPAQGAEGGPTAQRVFVTAGFAAAAMLAAWLLTVTGQAARTQRAVDEATTELRHEVAERRQAEQRLAASEARLLGILDHAPLGIAFLDPHGKLLQGNPHLFRMLGSPPEALLGQTVASITLPEDLPALQRQHRQLLSGELAVVRQPLRLARRGGNPALVVRMACTALRSAEGRVQYMVAVIEDLTEHLQLEQAERARQRAEADSRAKSEFVSRMSHELRTPLNAMLGFAQLLGLDRQPALHEHHRQWVQQIQRAGWHLLELVNDTLDLARIESGSVRLQLEALDLTRLATECVDLVGTAATSRGVVLDLELAPDLPPVSADATRLKQVLMNLLSNAVKYNRQAGRVTVRAALTATGPEAAAGSAAVQLDVIDTGLGMSPEQMVRLFEPYNRLGREGSGVEGTGIGLVIARRLAEMMGGTLRASSRAGAGSTFSLVLPAAADAVRPPQAPLPTPTAPYRQRLVLYIEDNPTNVEVMRGMLHQRPQVKLEVADTGEQGLAKARRLRPDLVLLDMQLPDASGTEVLRQLVAHPDTATIPVIIVSADATPARVEKALTLGAARYVTKPVELATFLQVLDEVLGAIDTRYG
ncbi:MAG: response regulator [Rubrivivax sp.]|nr:response regulator [Rubrivivax sp.]